MDRLRFKQVLRGGQGCEESLCECFLEAGVELAEYKTVASVNVLNFNDMVVGIFSAFVDEYIAVALGVFVIFGDNTSPG